MTSEQRFEQTRRRSKGDGDGCLLVLVIVLLPILAWVWQTIPSTTRATSAPIFENELDLRGSDYRLFNDRGWSGLRFDFRLPKQRADKICEEPILLPNGALAMSKCRPAEIIL